MNCREKKKGRLLFIAAGIVLTVALLRRRSDLGTPAGSGFNKTLIGFFGYINQYIPWHHLPPWLGALNLLALRDVLRQQNLYDTSPPRSPDAKVINCSVASLSTRNSDGTCNDLQHPEMGSAMQRFGRNVPRQYTYPDKEPALLTPSPRVVSQRLLARKSFRPAESLNLLAAAWIQFQIHDWFSHERSKPGNEFRVPLDANDNWPESPMQIQRTPADSTRLPAESDAPPTYLNRDSHWWDGSQIYGSDQGTTDKLRAASERGKLIIDEKSHLLPTDPHTGLPRTGFTDNWWIGLALLHTLFTREHNAIFDELKRQYPYWTDDQLFDTARLVNVGLMAKIHTVEWTPAILAHPTLKIAMNANWWGFETEYLYKVFGRITSIDLISGIPGSATDHNGVPFALTEEFTSVYRLHPLIPDEITFWSVSDGTHIKDLEIEEVAFKKAQNVVLDHGITMADAFYSFGICHPGAITLHNYPDFLRRLEMKDENGDTIKDEKGNAKLLDLAAVDIMRDRERGVPRYNQFRQLLHRPPVKTFGEITSNRVWAQELSDVYGGDVNRVDLMVGMFAEDLPAGFGFSDTAFRVFILMASRRLKSDRFFSTDYRPEIYTPAGLKWIDENDMKTVLLRHYSELKPALREVPNAFAPWRIIA
ncbi:MAG TPA: peroxidase family protein [Chthoniobacterales bacterium]|nr:peroxidase family protein [Chthoniobacterales bacterium]